MDNHQPSVLTRSLFMSLLMLAGLIGTQALAQVSLPGTDPSSQMETAGSLLKLIDTAVFTWIARLLAGMCVLSAGWSLKEQKYNTAVICILAAVVIGTAPAWVKNIFAMGGGGVLQ